MRHNGMGFLDYLISENLEVFSPPEVVSFFGKIGPKVYLMLEDLVQRGWLTRLKKGLYARNPQEKRGQDYLPNWHKVAAALVHPYPYYIGYYSALQIHDLITQPSLREYLVTQKRMNPKTQIILGVPFEVTYISPERFFGFKKTWINDHDKVYCSDLEKTMIDCLYQPQYAGGFEAIVKAMHKSRQKIRPNILVQYALNFKVQAVVKRLGFLLEKLALFPTEQNQLNQIITESYTKLDPSIDLKGSFHRNWRIEDNLGIEEVIQTIYT